MNNAAKALKLAAAASQESEEYAKGALYNARQAHMWAEESSMYIREASALLADEAADNE